MGLRMNRTIQPDYYCSRQAFAIGSSCLQQTRFLDDCSGLRMAMQRQERSMRTAEATQQSACAAGPGQECSDLTNSAQSESRLYQELQRRYQMCRQRSLTAYPAGGYGGYPSGPSWNPLGVDLDYP